MEGLARAGNGTSEFVKEGERMQPKVRTITSKDGHLIWYMLILWCYFSYNGMCAGDSKPEKGPPAGCD